MKDTFPLELLLQVLKNREVQLTALAFIFLVSLAGSIAHPRKKKLFPKFTPRPKKVKPIKEKPPAEDAEDEEEFGDYADLDD